MRLFTTDYHTHTIFSHGTGTIESNVKAAEELGLKQIAITDHGLRHVFMGIRKVDIPKMKKEIFRLNESYNVKTLFGVESNIVGRDGTIDIKASQFGFFDIILCGFHKLVWGKNLSETLKFIVKNDFNQIFRKGVLPRFIAENTKTYINAIIKNPIDIITHINHDMLVDVVEVAKAARDYGTLIEISAKKEHLTTEELARMADTGVNFIVNSDAHSSKKVGDFALAIEQINMAGININQVKNFNDIPKLRSHNNG